MLGRTSFLISPALPCCVLLTLLVASEARAHRLNVDKSVKLVQKVRIESYFNDDSRPKQARIEVFRDDSPLPFLEGQLDDQGAFEFLAEAEPLRVVVSAGEGHRAELRITPPVIDKTEPPPPIEHKIFVPVAAIIAGISLVLAAGAFLLSLRNMKRLQEMKKSMAGPQLSNLTKETPPPTAPPTGPTPR